MDGKGIERREFLKRSIAAAAALPLGAFLIACGKDREAESIDAEDKRLDALKGKIDDSRTEIGAKIQGLEQRFANSPGARAAHGIIGELRQDISLFLALVADNGEAITYGQQIRTRALNKAAEFNDGGSGIPAKERDYLRRAWEERAQAILQRIDGTRADQKRAADSLRVIQAAEDYIHELIPTKSDVSKVTKKLSADLQSAFG